MNQCAEYKGCCFFVFFSLPPTSSLGTIETKCSQQPELLFETIVCKFQIMAAPVPGQKKQYIIGLDYGTTNTSVAYYAFLRNAPPVESIALVKTVQNWPDDPLHGGSSQVPSKTRFVCYLSVLNRDCKRLVISISAKISPFGKFVERILTSIFHLVTLNCLNEPCLQSSTTPTTTTSLSTDPEDPSCEIYVRNRVTNHFIRLWYCSKSLKIRIPFSMGMRLMNMPSATQPETQVANWSGPSSCSSKPLILK